jgi:mannose-1-phosphate guanylyltransferase
MLQMRARPWVVILAGGEGFRLRPLTRSISGDDRPKQFCAVVGTETLLGDTRRRAGESNAGGCEQAT